MQPTTDLWPSQARHWHLLGPPLRPSRDDVAIVEGVVRALLATPRVLLLGVTPELATLAWPPGTELAAVDRCAGMIGAVWPSSGTPAGARAVQGDWRALPIDDASVDLVLGDAVMTLLAFPHDTEALFTEVHRVLRPEGRFVVRALVPHGTREDVSGVSRDLLAGRIGSLHAFKVRLLMALHPSPEQGTRLADAWDAWQAVAPDPRALATELGWKLEALATIAVYRDSPVVYAFPTVEELDVIARRAHLARDAVQVPRYELGDRCPTITWRKR
jgi:SAM-dependent methyltransferase